MSEPLYKLSDKALFTSLGDDIVALNVERGRCYGMEKVTAKIWELLASPLTLNELCQKLIELYEVDPETCRSDVEALLLDLEAEGLVERHQNA